MLAIVRLRPKANKTTYVKYSEKNPVGMKMPKTWKKSGARQSMWRWRSLSKKVAFVDARPPKDYILGFIPWGR